MFCPKILQTFRVLGQKLSTWIIGNIKEWQKFPKSISTTANLVTVGAKFVINICTALKLCSRCNVTDGQTDCSTDGTHSYITHITLVLGGGSNPAIQSSVILYLTRLERLLWISAAKSHSICSSGPPNLQTLILVVDIDAQVRQKVENWSKSRFIQTKNQHQSCCWFFFPKSKTWDIVLVLEGANTPYDFAALNFKLGVDLWNMKQPSCSQTKYHWFSQVQQIK